MSWGFNSKPNPKACAHSETITVCSAGLEREMCEICGNVSVHYMSGISSEVDRNAFARPADELQIAAVPRHVRVGHLAEQAHTARGGYGFGVMRGASILG